MIHSWTPNSIGEYPYSILGTPLLESEAKSFSEEERVILDTIADLCDAKVISCVVMCPETLNVKFVISSNDGSGAFEEVLMTVSEAGEFVKSQIYKKTASPFKSLFAGLALTAGALAAGNHISKSIKGRSKKNEQVVQK